MSKKMTHSGCLAISNDLGSRRLARLRETKSFWVDQYGAKYRKTDGSMVGSWVVSLEIDLSSIKPIK